MSVITSNEKLFQYAARARGRVVLVTGGAAGPGREAAMAFAKHGATVAIGDVYASGAQATVETINNSPSDGGKAYWKRCDVTIWEEQVALFEWAVTKFGCVDIVIAGARIGEVQNFGALQFTDGKPAKPHHKTLNVNLIGAIYTTQLALHYLPKTRNHAEPFKYVVLLGSLASWTVYPDQEIFVTSQYGLLGFAKSVQVVLTLNGIRIATVQATSTPGKGDTDLTFRKTGYAMFFCATNPDPDANGSVWSLLQNGAVQRLGEVRETRNLGDPPSYADL